MLYPGPMSPGMRGESIGLSRVQTASELPPTDTITDGTFSHCTFAEFYALHRTLIIDLCLVPLDEVYYSYVVPWVQGHFSIRASSRRPFSNTVNAPLRN
jgi:hypothetical protein